MAEDDIDATLYLIRSMIESTGDEIDHLHPDNTKDRQDAGREIEALQTLLAELKQAPRQPRMPGERKGKCQTTIAKTGK